MSEFENAADTLKRHQKAELKEILATELGDAYGREITDSLRNDFLKACYTRLAPDEDPVERARTHDNYSDSWRRKRVLATALRMLLAERGVRERDTPLTSLDKPALVQLIIAIRMRDDGAITEKQSSTEHEPPEREAPADQRFDETLTLGDGTTEDQIQQWVDERRDSTDSPYAVYVLDATPPRDGEGRSLEALRARVHEKPDGEALTKLERAAEALSRGERVYYVGYTNDVIDRISRHLGGASHGSAQFTHTFRPKAVAEITWYDDEQTARRRERERAQELTIPGEAFGYWE